MADKTEIIKIIKKLNEYNFHDKHPIAVIGPKLGNSISPDKHLRIYAYGGCIGEIPEENSNCQFKLANKDFVNYLSDKNEKIRLQSIIENENAQAALCSKEYLDLILKAANSKFVKTNGDHQERMIENRIVHRFINDDSLNWAAVDMEFTIGKKSGKHDIVFYDASENPSYMITELKYDCDNTDNIDKHINDMYKLYLHKKEAVSELNRRMEYLCKYGIVSEKIRKSFHTSKENIEMKFAVLYVNGAEEKAINDVKTSGKAEFDSIDSNIKKLFYFQYAENEEEINIEKMKQLSDILGK